jgi:Dimerisation domain
MVIGFWVSKTLMTAVEIDLFTKLSNSKAVTMEQLRTDILGMEKRPADVFVTAVVSFGLLDRAVTNKEYEEKESAKRLLLYSNSEISEKYLNRNRPSCIGDFIIMMDKHLYNRWDKIGNSLKTNKPVVVQGQASGQDMYDLAKTNNGIEQIQMFTHFNVWY